MNFTFFSCVTEEPPSTAMVSGVETDQAVEDARVWFGPQVEFEIPPKNGMNSKGKTQTKKIHWNRAITHEEGRVIEVAVSYSAHAVPMREDTTRAGIKEKKERAFYRLLIRKDSLGNYSKSLLKFFPGQTVKDQSRLEVNNFMTLDKQFSGDIQLTDWEENLEVGWRITDGTIVQTYLPKVDSGGKSKNLSGAALNCVSVTEEVCEATVYPSPPGYLDTVEVHCYDVTYLVGPGCSNVGPDGPGWYNGGGGSGGGPTGPVPGGSPGGSGSGGIPSDEEIGLFVTTLTLDDNYIYSGIKIFIPSILSLENGQQIIVDFGITQSDNKTANQKVAVKLIEGLKEAIKIANENLDSHEKITRIFVAATTNGQHGSTSNHYDGTAIDISRINGVNMASTGVTNQIIQLQLAMDAFPGVRENFGPYFKHKYSKESDSWNYNHPVGGHGDHIHFSVR